MYTDIGETLRNLETHIVEHQTTSHNSEPARHLAEHPNHSFVWKVLFPARGYWKRKIIEAFMIQQTTPSLNKQAAHFITKLFPKGIT